MQEVRLFPIKHCMLGITPTEFMHVMQLLKARDLLENVLAVLSLPHIDLGNLNLQQGNSSCLGVQFCALALGKAVQI